MNKIHKYIIIAVVVLCTGFIVLLYGFGYDGQPVLSIARTLSLPAASINKQTITIDRFYRELDALKYIADDDNLGTTELKGVVWTKLQDEFVLRSLAKELDVSSTPELLNTYANQFGYSKDSEAYSTLLGIFGSEQLMFESIIEPLVLEDGVVQALITKMDNDQAEYINTVHQALLEDPSQFDRLQTETRELYNLQRIEGDFLINQEDLKKSELHSYVADLKPGDITQIIGTYDGYRVLKVSEIFEDDSGPVWQFEEIFVPSSPLPEVLSDKRKQAKIKIFASRLMQIK